MQDRDLMRTVNDVTDVAIDALAARIQQHLKHTTGDFAAQFFSNAKVEPVRDALLKLAREYGYHEEMHGQ